MEKVGTKFKQYSKDTLNNTNDSKELKQELEDFKEKFSVLFNDATSGIAFHRIVYDNQKKPINYIITDINPRYEKILAIKRGNVINKLATEVYNVEKPPFLKAYSKVAETQKSLSFESYFQPMEKYFKISVISHKKGEFITVFEDISQRKISDQKLKESEEKYRLITENANDLISILDKRYKYEYVNEQTYKKILGYSKKELIGNSALKLIHTEDFTNFIKSFWGKNEVDERIVELRIKHKNGRWVWLQVNYKRYRNNKNEKKFLLVSRDITLHKNAERKLKDSEEKYRSLFDNMTAAFAYHEVIVNENNKPIDYKYLEANPSFENLTGLKAEEITGKTVTEILPGIENDPADWIGKFGNVGLTGIPLTVEDYSEPLDKWYKVSGYSPKKGFFAVTFTEITEQKKVEQKLRESEEKYRELVSDANSIILKWGTDGIISFINEFGEVFFGYSKSQLVGKHVIGTIVPKTETTGRNLESLMKEICDNPEKYKNNVNENITRYGRKVWISWTNKAIKDNNGNLIGILSVGNDMTESRRASLKIKESEEKFRTITEQSFIGIAILKDFKFKYINQQFADTLGYTNKKILKWRPKEFFKVIHPEHRERVMEIAERKYLGKDEIVTDVQFRIIKKNKDVAWLEIISKIIPFKGESAVLITTLDITANKKAEKLILKENKKLVELNKMRKDIITRVSHELKTPLTSIYGASQILLQHFKPQISGEVQNFIEILYRGALRLKKLVENLIDASRIESGKLELNLKEFNLSTIINECAHEMMYLINNRKLTLKLDLPNRLNFNVDKIRLQQVITNILSNAIKNTPLNGKINVVLADNPKNIDILIKDTGVGITQKEKKLLFEKFGKIERYGMDLGVDIEGSGLGLFISKEIVELHGGEILVESQGRNQGTLFIVRLWKHENLN